MKATKNLTEGNVYKNMLLYSVPLIASSVLSLSYSTIDGMIAGRFVGAFAMGAISATSAFNALVNAIFIGISEGFAIYASQLFGKKDYGCIKKSIVSMTWFVALISLLLSGLVLLFRGAILNFLKVDPILRADTERYFSVYVAGYVVYFVNKFLATCLQSLGISSFALYVTLMSAILNVGGNLLTVLVFDMGVAGLALSTLISALAASAVYFAVLRRAFREMSVEPTSLRPHLFVVRQCAGFTFPVTVQKMAFLGVGLIIAPMVNGLGAAATTAYGIANQVYSIGVMTLWAATSAFACYTGQAMGEGDTKKIRRGMRIGFEINSALMLPMVLAISLFAGPIVSIFFPEGYVGEAFDCAFRYARIFAPLIFVQLVDHIFHAYLRGIGKVSLVLWTTLVGGVCRVALTVWLIPLMNLDGAFLAEVLSWGIDALICLVFYAWKYRTDEQLSEIIASRGPSLPLGQKQKAP